MEIIDLFVDLQEKLSEITQENARETAHCISSYFYQNDDSLNSLVSEIYAVLTLRVNIIPPLVEFIKELMTLKNDSNAIEKLPIHILRNVTTCKDYFSLLFVQKLLHAGIISRMDTFQKILSISEHRIPNCRQIFQNDLHEDFPLFFNKLMWTSIEEFEDGCMKKSLLHALKYDDFEMLQQLSSAPDFNFNLLQNSPMLYCPVVIQNKATLLEFSALFGSINCFKFLTMNNADFRGVIDAAPIIGGNTEIIRIWDASRPLQPSLIHTAMLFRRNDVINWMITTKDCHFNDQFFVTQSIATNNAYFFKEYINECKISAVELDSCLSTRKYFCMKYLIENYESPINLCLMRAVNNLSIVKDVINKQKKPYTGYHFDLISNVYSPELFDYLNSIDILPLSQQNIHLICCRGTKELLEWMHEKKSIKFMSDSLRSAIQGNNYETLTYLLSLDDFKFDDEMLSLILETSITKKEMLLPFLYSPKLDETVKSVFNTFPFILSNSGLTERASVSQWIEQIENFTVEMIPIVLQLYLTSQPCVSTNSQKMIELLDKTKDEIEIRQKIYEKCIKLKIKIPCLSYQTPVIEHISKMALDDLSMTFQEENQMNKTTPNIGSNPCIRAILQFCEKYNINFDTQSQNNAFMLLSSSFSYGLVSSSSIIKKSEEIRNPLFTETLIRIAFFDYKEITHVQCDILLEFFDVIEALFEDDNMKEHKKDVILTLSLVVPALGHCFPFEVAKILEKHLNGGLKDEKLLLFTSILAQSVFLNIEMGKMILSDKEKEEVLKVMSKYVSNMIEKDSEFLVMLTLTELGEKYAFSALFNILKTTRRKDLIDYALNSLTICINKKWTYFSNDLSWFVFNFPDENVKNNEFKYFIIISAILKFKCIDFDENITKKIISLLKCMNDFQIPAAIKQFSHDIENLDFDVKNSLLLLDFIEKTANDENQTKTLSDSNFHILFSILLEKHAEIFASDSSKIALVAKLIKDMSMAKEKRYVLTCFLFIVRNMLFKGYDDEFFEIFSSTITREPAMYSRREPMKQPKLQIDSYYFDSDDGEKNRPVDDDANEMDFMLISVISSFAKVEHLRSLILTKYEKYLIPKSQNMPSARYLMKLLNQEK